MQLRPVAALIIAACASPSAPPAAPAVRALPTIEPLPVGASDPVYRLPPGQTFYFAYQFDVGAQFIELRSNGTYRTVDREHMGVGEDDAGRWRQAESGELYLCSEYTFANVYAGPLWMGVAGQDHFRDLPEVARMLRARLAAQPDATIPLKSIEWLLTHGAEDYHHPHIFSDVYSRDLTRVEVEAFAHAIDAYVTNGNENLMRTVPRVYREVVYLDGWWRVPPSAHGKDELDGVHSRLDTNAANKLWALPAIDENAFRIGTHMTQPFVVHTEANACIQHAVADIPDDKKDRLIPHCRSF
jgi:hypothetical protein